MQNNYKEFEEWLKPTKYIDFESEIIQNTLKQILSQVNSDSNIDKAIAIYNYVRDNIPFGWGTKFYDYTASQVLTIKIGYCNTKSTLFIALLRAANIPARQHFVAINAKILDGFVDLSKRTKYVDHAYTEVWLNNRWIKLDGYVVDSKLYSAAKKKLAESNLPFGWGVHKCGEIEWDGWSDCMVQYVENEKMSELSNADFGVYDDVDAYYSHANTLQKFDFIMRFIFLFFSYFMNKNVSSIRDS